MHIFNKINRLFWLPNSCVLFYKYTRILRAVRKEMSEPQKVQRVSFRIFWAIAAGIFLQVAWSGRAKIVLCKEWPIEVNQAILWISYNIVPNTSGCL
jgi:hypothetical protein